MEKLLGRFLFFKQYPLFYLSIADTYGSPKCLHTAGVSINVFLRNHDGVSCFIISLFK